nr:hypothetical protein GCM10020093_064780 [Planobispora longispora]
MCAGGVTGRAGVSATLAAVGVKAVPLPVPVDVVPLPVSDDVTPVVALATRPARNPATNAPARNRPGRRRAKFWTSSTTPASPCSSR